jgi:hypothetical protein
MSDREPNYDLIPVVEPPSLEALRSILQGDHSLLVITDQHSPLNTLECEIRRLCRQAEGDEPCSVLTCQGFHQALRRHAASPMPLWLHPSSNRYLDRHIRAHLESGAGPRLALMIGNRHRTIRAYYKRYGGLVTAILIRT